MNYREKINEVLAAAGIQPSPEGALPEIDSLEVMNLVSQLEETVGMMIPGDELVPDNFKTVDGVVALLTRMAAASEPA
ncbi:MAG TPA: phosphopantetheine-binding protein [Polyangiaceae bacterium]|nr:phosphopantetheine-binding protein [Polyangiaceae bacterium]